MVQRDVEDGMKLGVKGTPSLFINGRRVTAKSYEELKTSVDAALTPSMAAGRYSGVISTTTKKFAAGFSLKTTPFCAFPSECGLQTV